MKYRVRYAAAVVKELEKMSPEVAQRIRSKINRLSDGLAGDVKRLTNYSPEYRLRVGDWRVLFNVDGDTISIERPPLKCLLIRGTRHVESEARISQQARQAGIRGADG